MTTPNTGFYATVIADSIISEISDEWDARLTTIEACFPRFILAELNTHGRLARNAASSRAIPVAKQLERVKEHPFIPEAFPINKPGMSATEYIYPDDALWPSAKSAWLYGRDRAIETAERLLALNLHKQTANRVLEPYLWQTDVISATEWINFLNLRTSVHAQPEFRHLANLIKDAIESSTPEEVPEGGYHVPYVADDEFKDITNYGFYLENMLKVSSGRCAAVTLLNQQKKDWQKDLSRAENLVTNGHMSPFEHPAIATLGDSDVESSKFGRFWVQYRKTIPYEALYRGD